MSYKIKEKVKQYNKAIVKSACMQKELEDMIEEYGVPIDNLIAMNDI